MILKNYKVYHIYIYRQNRIRENKIRKYEKVLKFQQDKLGFSCSVVFVNKKSDLYQTNGDG